MAQKQSKEKMPIVMIHGMWGTPLHFKHWKQYFEEKGYMVYVPALPGHTEEEKMSGVSADKMPISHYVDFVLGFIQVEVKQPCILLGHSMGGLIARVVAGKTSDVRMVISVAGAAPKGIRAASWNIIRRILMHPIQYLVPMLLTGNAFSIRPDDARELMMNKLDPKNDYGSETLYPYAESGLAARQLLISQIPEAQIGKPLLVVAGEQDKITPPTVQNAIRLKHHASIEWHKGGHLPMLEGEWRVTARRILWWILFWHDKVKQD